MKKLAILLLIFSMLLLMTSCDIYDLITQLVGGGNGPSEDPDDNNYSEMTDSDYDQLNELFENIGENLTVKVESNNRGVILNAEYVISEDSVRYTVEQLNMLPEDADINKLPESMITEYSGEAHLNENGEIIVEGGEVILLPEGEVMSGNISFDEKNFRDVKRSADGFEGKVISVSAFLGVDMQVDSMNVKVDYSETSISRMVLTYIKGDATVTVTYEFA